MSSEAEPVSFGAAICELIGLDPGEITSLSVIVAVNNVPYVRAVGVPPDADTEPPARHYLVSPGLSADRRFTLTEVGEPDGSTVPVGVEVPY